ncbi:putative porin [Pedobacter sp. SYSU D00535]|uniref:putative porin n=1 Tax=Pedobacter sp. SYSU D00535 TaxID=2810308 RepID=UPI001A9670D3|nr:putative porin [Pedobacter sp. SYSU D00535]
MKYLFFVLAAFVCLCIQPSLAQERPVPDAGAELDSLRKLEEEGQDTVIFTAKYIRYTTLGLLQDSTQTVPLDTTLENFHHYNPLNRPEHPTVNLGNLGLAYRQMLFEPSKRIGFDPGFYALDIYRLTQDSLKYYRARTPFTSLYYVNGTLKEQTFRVIHSQNIKPNWNIGANYFRIGARGFYINQNSDHLNASLFTWYESPKKRYNILVNGLFNTLKAAENGGIVDERIFEPGREPEGFEPPVRLTGQDPVRQTWRQKNFFLKQFYYIGRIDSLVGSESSSILPTQRLSHSLSYSSDQYKFYKNQRDDSLLNVFPGLADTNRVVDSTIVRNVRNEFMYSFYLRGRSVKFIRNEMKLDLGLQHDFYSYNQMGDDLNFQNITLKGNIGYRFSDRVSLNGEFQQIAQGRNAGDYLYDAQTQILLSRSVGRIILGAYIQNRSPERLMQRSNYHYHQWSNDFVNEKYNNLSFTYVNPKFHLRARAEYFLINNYLYYRELKSDTNAITPVQAGSPINLLKLTLRKDFHLGKFNLQSFVAVQQTDFQEILRTPQIYTYNTFYYGNRFFNAVTANLGFDVRWNSSFPGLAYAPNVGQFYNASIGSDTPIQYESYPIVDLWARFSLRRANVFVRYDYANQGLFSKGYFTVRPYPMPDALFRLGIHWNFYN